MSRLKELHAWHIQNLMDAEPEAQVVELVIAEKLEQQVKELKKALTAMVSCPTVNCHGRREALRDAYRALNNNLTT